MLCGKDGKWKTRLEELLQPNQVVVLLSLGDVKYDVLSYLTASSNMDMENVDQILKEKRERTSLKSEGQIEGIFTK